MNAYYYYYFRSKLGIEITTPEDDWENETLLYMASPASKAEQAAGALGISSLWLTSVPVVFTKKTFAMYIGPSKLNNGIVPEAEGICVKHPGDEFRQSLRALVDGQLEPVETPPPCPYALIRAAAEMNQTTVENYIRNNFHYDDNDYTETIIRNVFMAGCNPPAGSMETCDQGVIRDFAKAEDITIDEAASGFEVKDENCLINLLIAFKLCVSKFSVTYNKDGSLLITYPGYKLSDYTFVQPVVNEVRDRPSPRGSSLNMMEFMQ